MAYTYSIIPTTNPLTADLLYEGKVVCFNDIQTNPNNVGILNKNGKHLDNLIYEAVINNTRYVFDKDGKINGLGNPVLYGVLSNGDIDPTISTAKTRGASEQGEANTVSLTTMSPKDYFACEALNALIMSHPNPLSMDDGTIATMAAKSYKIAQAMAKEAYGSRQNDKKSEEESGTAYVEVDETSLQNNTERILYNINESIKANTKSNKETGIKVSNIDKVKFDGTPTVKLDATSEVKVTQLPNVTISGTPNVNVANTPDVNVTNMPSVPTEPVSITGTVSVDNFPSNS